MKKIDEQWFDSVDRFGKVGSRHHVIPKFVLQKWADPNGRVWAKSKHDRKEGIRNVRDLGITDFYTLLAIDGQLDSSMEELLCEVEGRAATVLTRLNNPLVTDTALTHEEFYHVAEFVAFQITRSPRRRREHELTVDWYGKTLAASRLSKKVTEDELRPIEFFPHQNEHIENIGPTTVPIIHELYRRPVSVVTLDRPLLLIGDEPVIVNTSGDDVHHLPTCWMTDDELEKELKCASMSKSQGPHEVRTLVHLYTTQPHDIQEALEIAMPISPYTLLLFGNATKWDGVVVREQVTGTEANELAKRINESVTRYSLDVVVGRINDQVFRKLAIPERTPLLAVCGSTGAAKDAATSVPKRLRPRRLDRQIGLSGA